MTENSGNYPYDPRIAPAPAGREPLPGVNGPISDRVAAGPPMIHLGLPQHDRKLPEQKDAFREIVETVVFVVVLVLLLKAFMAEAFVIPTGSMATTLLGYHRNIECPECGFHFPLNLSKEMDQAEQNRQIVRGCRCPNCELKIDGTNSPQFRVEDRSQ